MCIYTVHIYLGDKKLLKGTFGGGGNVRKICISFANVCRSTHFKANCLSASPYKPLKCTYPFLLFHDAERWPYSFFLSRGEGIFVALQVPSLDIAYHWATWQSVDLDHGFTCGAGNGSSCSVIPAQFKKRACWLKAASHYHPLISEVVVWFFRDQLFQSLSSWQYCSEQMF